MWQVPGQDRAVRILRGALGRGEVAHAWALVGPSGVGQEGLVRALAAALNCPTRGRAPDEPCGACPTCARVARGAHPALWEFVPVGGMHRVDEVRDQWLPPAARSSTEGSWKVLRIVDADRMNDAAANAFLKGLEEPAPGTVWVLDVADPDELPETVMSRCRAVRVAPLAPGDLDAQARALGLDDPAERALAVRACMGAPLTLRRLVAEGGLDDLRAHRSIPQRLRTQGQGAALLVARELDEEVRRHTAAVREQAKVELADLAELYGDDVPKAVSRQLNDRATRREREARTVVVQAALDDLLGWYRDCLVVAAGGDPSACIHADAASQVRADAEALGAHGLLAAVDQVLATRDALEANVGVQLALEALFLDLAASSLAGARASAGRAG